MRKAELRRLVEALCAPACAGRATATPEGRAARAVVAAALPGAVEQAIPDGGANLYARVPGARRDGAILVGAHYDHLGRDGELVYWGADDNAAAVAALAALGRALAARPAARDVWLVAFDGEEPPRFLTPGMGSAAFAAAPPLPLDEIDLMICLDLVGHALAAPPPLREALFVFGAETSEGTAALVDGVEAGGVRAFRAGINLLPPLSDYHAFRERRVPFLFLTCGRSRRYHTPDDTPDALDYDKLAATARWLERLVRAAAEAPGRRRFTDGRDDFTSVRTFVEIAEALPDAAPLAARARALADRLVDGRLPPAAFTEARLLLAAIEATVA